MASTKSEINNRSVDELRRDIYGTRQRISEDISVLEGRFGPDGLIDRASTYIKDQANRSNIYKTVRNHPVCASLSAACLASAAAGVAWMAAKGPEPTTEVSEAVERVRGPLRQLRQKARELKERMMGKAVELKEQAKEKLQGAKDQLESRQMKQSGQSTTESVKETLNEYGQSAKETARQYKQKASEALKKGRMKFNDARWRIKHTARENPLSLAVAAVAVGVLISELLPKSEFEDRLVGKGKEKMGLPPEQEGQPQQAQPQVQGTGAPEGERSMEEDKNQPQPQELTPQIAC